MQLRSKLQAKFTSGLKQLRVRIRRQRKRAKNTFEEFQKSFARRKARIWNPLYKARYRLLVLVNRYGFVAVSLFLGVLIAFSLSFSSYLQHFLALQFNTTVQLETLRNVCIALGGALVSATAIVFSLVMFAMQVNVERMPHGLFGRLSSDMRLFGAFASTFLLATALTILSTVLSPKVLGLSAIFVFWAIVLILLLFLYSYRRALKLINPVYQLSLVVERNRGEMRAWTLRAERARPLLTPNEENGQADVGSPRSNHDLARLTYFHAQPMWTAGGMRSLRYAISYARQYAEQGDHEVSGAALSAIVRINEAYVEAKGRTFFAEQILHDNALVTDELINESLEHLRQNARIGISRGDEQQIEQTFHAMAALARLYLTIDYSTEHSPKTHAHYAVGYLSDAVLSVVPHEMPDVAMEGVRLMGESALNFLAIEGPESMQIQVEKIGAASRAGILKDSNRPITLTGIEQLAALSLNLFRVRTDSQYSVQFAAEKIRAQVLFVAKLILSLPDPPLHKIHSTYLGPYYSSTSSQALASNLIVLFNAVIEADANDEAAQGVVRNFAEWLHQIYLTDRELLLFSIEKRSQFTFDMVHWIKTLTRILLAVSNAPACTDHFRDQMRNYAERLVSIYSFMPTDEETIAYLEIFRITETLYDLAAEAYGRECEDVARRTTEILLSWTFDAGQFRVGWNIFERGIYALAALAVSQPDAAVANEFKESIERRIADGALPDVEQRNHVSAEISERARTLYRGGHWSSAIEAGIANADHQRLRPLLEDVAQLISPQNAEN